MQIEIIVTSKSGNIQRYIKEKQAGVPIRIDLAPGSEIEVTVDGVKQTGTQTIAQQKTQLKRLGNSLLIETVDSEVQVELANYYPTDKDAASSVLSGDGWSFAPAENMKLLHGEISLTAADIGTVATTPLLSNTSLLGLVGATGLYAVGSERSGSSPAPVINTTAPAFRCTSQDLI